MSGLNVGTSQESVKGWFKDQNLEFCHLAMRITVEGDSTFVQFNYLPKDKHNEYVSASNEHFKRYSSLLHRAKFEYFFSEPDTIPKPEATKEISTSNEAEGCSWSLDCIGKIPQGSSKSESNKEKRRSEYYEILTTISPALAEKKIYAFAYCGLLDPAGKDERTTDADKRNIGEKDTGFGVAVYYVNDKDEEENKGFSEVLFRKCLLELCNQLTFNIKTQSEKLLKQRVKVEEFRTETRKAAISQVMDRQMSHNINSHVLAKLANLESYNAKKMQVFLGYLKNRIEFIADIVTSQPLVTFPSKLSDGVVKRFFNGSDSDEEWPRYLIQYISGSSEVTYEKNVYEGKKNISVIFKGDVETIVALPNDILGAQAFYVILENIIRNSVKHSIIPTVDADSNGKSITKKLLELVVAVDKKFEHNDYCKITIWDNLGKANSNARKENNYSESKNLTFSDWMNWKVNRDILSEDGRLRQNDWGILEMKICSAYLRKYPLEDLDNESCDPKLLNIVLDENENLGHELYFLKPKLACIVMNDIPACINNVAEMESRGIHLVKKGDLSDLEGLLKFGDLKIIGKKRHEVSHKYLILEQGVLVEGEKVTSNQIVFELSRDGICKLCEGDDVELEILKEILPDGVCDMVCYTNVDKSIRDEDCKKIIFHDHPGACFDVPEVADALYYEPYGSSSPTQKIVNDCLALRENDSALKYELHLAATLNVGILDERIQAEVCRDDKVNKTLERMNIHIPGDKEMDLNRNDFHEVKSGGKRTIAIAGKIHDWVETEKQKNDYIIVHQGIIEKTVGGTDIEKIEAFIESFYKGGETNAELVIISGRGKPSNLPENVFYLPFSLVNQYVITYRSKIYLYQLLKLARRHNG
mgnify:CR=1 FL=1